MLIKSNNLIWYHGNGISCAIVSLATLLCISIYVQLFPPVGISYNYLFEAYERIWHRPTGLKKSRAFDSGGQYNERWLSCVMEYKLHWSFVYHRFWGEKECSLSKFCVASGWKTNTVTYCSPLELGFSHYYR